MQKICVVYSFKPSAWVSCQKIVANLLKSYQLSGDLELVPIPFAEDLDDHDKWTGIKQILEQKPSHIIFMDHRPHCVQLLEPLTRFLKEASFRPTFVFHIYGDFTLGFGRWKNTEALLLGHKVLWYAASARQRAMLSEFIPVEQIEICPFPVDEKEFFPSTALRRTFRESKHWQEGETIFVFTGRLSRQKRIHQLIQTFARWRRRTNARARLILVGDADKVGEPFLLRGEYEGEYFHHLLEVMDTLPETERAYIEFHGFRPNTELNAYYNAADAFVNISVHNDEDYGMSCAEALAAGLPLILTDWAGFSSFRRPGLEDAIRMVPVKIARRGKLVSLKGLARAFDDIQQRLATFDRSQIARASLAYTGLGNAGAIVAKGLGRAHTFEGYLPGLHEAARLETYQNWNTFADMKLKTFNDLYMKVYRHYVE